MLHVKQLARLFPTRTIVARPLPSLPQAIFKALDLPQSRLEVFRIGNAPAGEREHIAPAGSIGAGGSAPIHDLFDDVTQDKPAIFFSLHRRLAKANDGGDLSGHLEVLSVNARSVAGSELKMRNRALISAQMLAEARAWAEELTSLEIQHPRDLEPAWRRLETRYGIPYSTFWSLRYRADLKDIWASLHRMLQLAVEQERSRRAANLSHHQFITNAVNGAS
jgi:hypothetical protein